MTTAAAGAKVSMAWLPKMAKLALANGLPAASVRPAPTRLRATLPAATPAVGVTTTVYALVVPTCTTAVMLALVAAKLPTLTRPAMASSKVTVKVMASLVTPAVTLSLTAVTSGAWVSTA